MPIQDAIKKAKKTIQEQASQIPLGVAHGAGNFYKSTANAVAKVTDPKYENPPEEKTQPIEIGTKYSDIPKNIWRVLTATGPQIRQTQKLAQKIARQQSSPITRPIHEAAKKEVKSAEKTLNEIEPHLKHTGKVVSSVSEMTPDLLLSGKGSIKKAVNIAQNMVRAYGDNSLNTAIPLQIATKGNSHLGNAIQSSAQKLLENSK